MSVLRRRVTGLGRPPRPRRCAAPQRAETISSVLRNVSCGRHLVDRACSSSSASSASTSHPLIAGTAIIGVALGFGAQTIVRDYLAGLFVVLEDQYGVGDVIDAGAATGTVEWVSLRLTRLRDAEGVIWHVPNGEIKRVGNLSQRRDVGDPSRLRTPGSGAEPLPEAGSPPELDAIPETLRRRRNPAPTPCRLASSHVGYHDRSRPPRNPPARRVARRVPRALVRRRSTGRARPRRTDAPPKAPPTRPPAAASRTGPAPPRPRRHPSRRRPDGRRSAARTSRSNRRPNQSSRRQRAEPVVEPLPEAPRLRDRLSRTRAAFSGLVTGLRRGGDLTDDSWDELEETLLLADAGMATTQRILDGVRARAAAGNARDAAGAPELLRDELVAQLDGDGGADRALQVEAGYAERLDVRRGQRRREDDDRREARPARAGRRAPGRCWPRPTRSGPRRPSSSGPGPTASASSSSAARRAPTPARSSSTRWTPRPSPRRRSRARRHRRPPAHEGQPHGGAEEAAPHRRTPARRARVRCCSCSTRRPVRTV